MREVFQLSGAGNDFLALVEEGTEPTREEIAAWCARGLSLGADGLFLLDRSPAGVRMRYYNADGRPADLCLNGTRCAARLAFHLGWGEEEITVETGAGPVTARELEDGAIAIDVAVPPPPREMGPELASRARPGWLVAAGVPHFVVEWTASLAEAPIRELGPALRHHADFGPAGANVDFVRFVSPHELEIRSYERGVEAETLACGTGVLAAVAVAVARDRASLPVRVLTSGGCVLEVAARQDRWSQAGDARLLCRGVLFPEAGALPPPPAWR